MILIIIIFCELLLWISPRIINASRSYIKHSKECFIRYQNTLRFVKKLAVLLVFQLTSQCLDIWWNTPCVSCYYMLLMYNCADIITASTHREISGTKWIIILLTFFSSTWSANWLLILSFTTVSDQQSMNPTNWWVPHMVISWTILMLNRSGNWNAIFSLVWLISELCKGIFHFCTFHQSEPTKRVETTFPVTHCL